MVSMVITDHLSRFLRVYILEKYPFLNTPWIALTTWVLVHFTQLLFVCVKNQWYFPKLEFKNITSSDFTRLCGLYYFVGNFINSVGNFANFVGNFTNFVGNFTNFVGNLPILWGILLILWGILLISWGIFVKKFQNFRILKFKPKIKYK